MHPQPTNETNETKAAPRLQPTQPCDPRALSHFKHGLTGRIYFFSADEEAAYKHLYAGIESEFAPQGDTEAGLVNQIADDRWRLSRAVAIESGIFAEGAESFAGSPDASGDAEVDHALSQGRTWIAQAKNLNLLSLYESRAHRRLERNTAELRRLQSARAASLTEAVEEAAALAQAAEMKGERYNAADAFLSRGFEFSDQEIGRLVSRYRRILEAKKLVKTGSKPLRKAA